MNFENIKKIHFERLGKFRMELFVYGRHVVSVMRCPSCKRETTFFRRKGLLKIKCDYCSFESIMSLGDWIKKTIYEEKLERDVQSFFENHI